MINQLIKEIQTKNSVIVVGLDPYLEKIPKEIKEKSYRKYGQTLKGAAKAILDFNMQVIDLVKEEVVAVKPQIAFYEVYGHEGIKTFEETIQYAKSQGLIVIGDCKRGDILSTSEAYAIAHLGQTQVENQFITAFNEDFVTVNPYLGSDGIKPFIDICKKYNKGIFVLVKTSNPSSGEYQNQILSNGQPLYLEVAKNIAKYQENNQYSFIGCVVGATYPKEARKIRKMLPNCFFLVPGYGTQGADGKMIEACFNDDGLGALISASRSILYPKLKENQTWQAAIKEVVCNMNQDINQYRH